MICVYCGKTTDETEALEHVVPESLGFRETLPQGAVCSKCNSDLAASIDSKVFNEPMMAAGPVAAGVKGKKGRARETVHTKKKGVVSKKGEGGVSMVGGNVGKPNTHDMSRLLAKAAVNAMVYRFGPEAVRAAYPELIRYVRMPKSRREIWPYEAKFMVPGLKPFWHLLEFPGTSGKSLQDVVGILISCPSGIFITPLRRDLGNFHEGAAQDIERLYAQAISEGWGGIAVDSRGENKDGRKAG